jgi:hypothetical protein
MQVFSALWMQLSLHGTNLTLCLLALQPVTPLPTIFLEHINHIGSQLSFSATDESLTVISVYTTKDPLLVLPFVCIELYLQIQHLSICGTEYFEKYHSITGSNVKIRRHEMQYN